MSAPPRAPSPAPIRSASAGAGLLLVVALAGCQREAEPSPPGSTPTGTTSTAAPVDVSAKADVHWKRGHQLAADLGRALELPEGWCQELGLYACEEVHAVRLGGTWWQNRVLTPVETPSVTTGLAAERMALAACHARVTLDGEGSPVVFASVDLEGTVQASAAADDAAALVRRLYAREPSAEELQALVDLSASLPDGAGWALGACFALATATEMLFW